MTPQKGIRSVLRFSGVSPISVTITGMQKPLVALGLLLAAAGAGLAIPAAGPQRLALQTQRSSPQDIEITGDLSGLAQGQSRFARYADLAALPQVTYTVKDDPDFDHPVQLSGVSLDTLLAALNPPAGKKQLVAAVGADGYEGHYTAEHRAQHHPFLVLKIDGKEPSQWTHGPNGEVFAPYFVTYPQFKPLFHIMTQPDAPQLPTGVSKLILYDETSALASLRPPAKAPASALQASRIIAVNCLRCHSNGKIGGTKSPFGWPQMALIAQGNPSAFGKYLVQPNRVNPEATMPPNPEFDAATVAAITAYFKAQPQ